jgi:hypothetical protein
MLVSVMDASYTTPPMHGNIIFIYFSLCCNTLICNTLQSRFFSANRHISMMFHANPAIYHAFPAPPPQKAPGRTTFHAKTPCFPVFPSISPRDATGTNSATPPPKQT